MLFYEEKWEKEFLSQMVVAFGGAESPRGDGLYGSPPDRRIGYAFAKDSATPIGEMKLGIVCSVNPSVSLTAHNSPCTGEAFLRKAKQTR